MLSDNEEEDEEEGEDEGEVVDVDNDPEESDILKDGNEN